MSLENVTYWVIDEADRMLDLGFEHQLHEISKMICSTILNASKKKIKKNIQILFFSATWPIHVQTVAENIYGSSSSSSSSTSTTLPPLVVLRLSGINNDAKVSVVCFPKMIVLAVSTIKYLYIHQILHNIFTVFMDTCTLYSLILQNKTQTTSSIGTSSVDGSSGSNSSSSGSHESSQLVVQESIEQIVKVMLSEEKSS